MNQVKLYSSKNTMKRFVYFLFAGILLTGCGQTSADAGNRMESIPASPDDTVKSVNGLSVNLIVLNDSMISIAVQNNSDNLIRAYSHVETYERHYDFFEIEVLTPDMDEIILSFYDDRDKSASIVVELKPGESFSHDINLLRWAERSVNIDELKRAGLYQLPHGIKIRAKYRNTPCDNCNEYYKSIWSGFIYSDWVDF